MVASLDLEESLVQQLNKLEHSYQRLQVDYDALRIELHNRKKEIANLTRLVEKQQIKIENLKKR